MVMATFCGFLRSLTATQYSVATQCSVAIMNGNSIQDNESNIVKSPYGSVQIPNVSLWELLKPALESRSQMTAIIDHYSNDYFTSSEVIKQVENLAAHFKRFGIAKGDRVGFHANDCKESIFSMLALIASGAVYVPYTSMFGGKPDQMRQLCEETNCTYFMCSKENLPTVQTVHQSLNFKHIFLLDDEDSKCISIRRLLGQKSLTTFTPPSTVPEDELCILFTSGTTSLPKAAIHTHKSVVAALAGMRTVNNPFYRQGDVVYSLCSLAHAPGVTITPFNLWIGATTVMAYLHDEQLFGDIIEKHKVTALMGFPYKMFLILNALEANPDKYDISSLQHIQIAGQKCSRMMQERVYKMFWNARSIISPYGQTELIGVGTFEYDNVHDLGTIGRPSSNTEGKIVDVRSGKALGPYQHGEIALRLPSVTKGYINRLDATKNAIRNGWLHTGDVGYYDETGRFYIVDRIRDLILCMDSQVTPADIENVILRHPAVAEAAVVGLPDDILTHAPAACVILHYGYSKSPEIAKQLTDMVAETLEDFQHLYGGVHFFDEFPRTHSGKLQKQLLVEKLIKSRGHA